MTNSPTIVIAGASGYIGRALIPELLKRFPEARIFALSRSAGASRDPRVTNMACDLFSLKELERCVPPNVDLAYYLVHSMGPTARMDQGSFADYDLILADNFARIMKAHAVKHVVYLGGLIPAIETRKLSLHLRSRLEVESTFEARQLPLTVLRAGLIVGTGGSSFQILTKLVRRLPVMVCPRWTQTLTTPVDLGSALRALVGVAFDAKAIGRVYDLAGCRPLAYVDMMRATAKRMNLKRSFLTVPLFTPTLSRLWVRLITGASAGLVYPLISSLRHPMVARPDHVYDPKDIGYAELIQNIEIGPEQKARPTGRPERRNTVRSVQRLPLPRGRDAEWVKSEYLRWLPRKLRPFLKVTVDGNSVGFGLFGPKVTLLRLRFEPARSAPDRQLLYIDGGRLAAPRDAGRLEFREVLNGRFILAAIHDFQPALPWALYRYTQAWCHLWVMKAFARHLAHAPRG